MSAEIINLAERRNSRRRVPTVFDFVFATTICGLAFMIVLAGAVQEGLKR
jgi:hypothetical protein